MSNMTFIYVEGEEQVGERDRFFRLCQSPSDVRFIEGGGCSEIERKVVEIKKISALTDDRIRIGGIVDRDWKNELQCKNFHDSGIYVLEVHEIENFFLHPETISSLIETMSIEKLNYNALLIANCDARAGSWIFGSARCDKRCVDYPRPSSSVKELISKLTWSNFADPQIMCNRICDLYVELNDEQKLQFFRLLINSYSIYARMREDESELWKRCEGKEIFGAFVHSLGFRQKKAAENAIFGLWKRNQILIPEQLSQLNKYIEEIRQGTS